MGYLQMSDKLDTQQIVNWISYFPYRSLLVKIKQTLKNIFINIINCIFHEPLPAKQITF